MLPFLWGAYEIARAQAVAAARKEANGKIDLEQIQQHIDAVAGWVPRLAEIIVKAGTIQKNGEFIETTAKAMKDDLDKRVKEVLALLQSEVE